MSTLSLNWQDLSRDKFLAEYWQKKPVLLRQAVSSFAPPISVDEVAGLALEDEIESRIIWQQHPETGKPWVLEHGPFAEKTLQQLPEHGWSLLVQGVDQWLPEVATLLEYFTFLPQWRFEDIMISIAPGGASVGPHVDQYDVFLCQIEGQRHWHWSLNCDQGLTYRTDTPLNILSQPLPDPTSSALLEPGDVLYLPPGIAHHGIAQSLSQTWSVGFRAPDIEEIFTALGQRIAIESDAETLRYTDPDITIAEGGRNGLNALSLQRLRQLIERCLNRPEVVADVMGALVTRQSMHQVQWQSIDDNTPPLDHDLVSWALGTRKTYFETRFYVNGASYEIPEADKALIKRLMSLEKMVWQDLYGSANTTEGRTILLRLWNLQLLVPSLEP